MRLHQQKLRTVVHIYQDFGEGQLVNSHLDDTFFILILLSVHCVFVKDSELLFQLSGDSIAHVVNNWVLVKHFIFCVYLIHNIGSSSVFLLHILSRSTQRLKLLRMHLPLFL